MSNFDDRRNINPYRITIEVIFGIPVVMMPFHKDRQHTACQRNRHAENRKNE
jgi:hypothetical protein